MSLTLKQSAFVREYLVDLNATQAAIRAEYSPRTAYSQGQRLLKNVEIQAAISEANTARAQRTEVTADRVISELAKLAFANLMDYFRVTDDGSPYIHLGDLTPEQTAALTEITVDEFVTGGEDDARMVRKVKVKMADKKGALELLARHFNLFGDITKSESDNRTLDAFTAALSDLAAQRSGVVN